MTVQDHIREYLETSGVSKYALALQAGLNPKAVKNILEIPGIRSDRRTLDALGEIMGFHLATPAQQVTYAKLIRDLSRATGDTAVESRNRVLISRLKKFLKAAGWVAETELVDRRRAIEKLFSWSAATLNLSDGSFETYKSDILTAISTHAGRNRPPGIRDVSGVYRQLHELLNDSDFPEDLKLISGTFLHYLDQQAIQPGDVTTEILNEYYLHRLAVSPKEEAKCRKHVKRISKLCTRLAKDPNFNSFGFNAVQHPFPDGRNKYGVEASVFSDLLSEFDGPVISWLKGEASFVAAMHRYLYCAK